MESSSRREKRPEPVQRSRTVVSEERIPERIAEEPETSDTHDCSGERTELRRSKRIKVPSHKYFGPEWSYYVDSGYICRVPLTDLEEEVEADEKPP